MSGFVLDMGSRHYVEKRLERADDLCGQERKLLAALKDSHCPACRGDGQAPYAGGDDDLDPCEKCDGSGFA